MEVYSTSLDYDNTDFQALLEGPQDEHDLDRLLKCAFNPTYIKELEFYSPTSDHGMTIQTFAPATPEALLEKEEAHATMALIGEGGEYGEGGEREVMKEGGGSMYTQPCHRRSRRLAPTTTSPKEGPCDLPDYMPKSGWTHKSRVRSARKRGTWSINTKPCSRDVCSVCEGQKHGRRRNNDHWTSEEVNKLVDAISAHGAGQWAELKKERFPESVRTAKHLTDKWRNLVKAFTVRPTSKKKVLCHTFIKSSWNTTDFSSLTFLEFQGNVKRRISPHLDKDCIEKIQRLAAVYPLK
ncbi:uncharacterized protein LOC123411369 isoform X2 [Hordeum vulgare subsp. vulgare]|nr:uncharacterized protein LOC123411369 isoform X2 [Hordeum vulgare subsp. vulgare]